MRSMRLATIDIGTNTALLLISEWQDGQLVELFNASGFVRLGEGLDGSGLVSEAALLRLETVLRSHMEHIRLFEVAHIIVTGTSASRDAHNSDRIRSLVKLQTGTDLTILTGDEEAKVTFLGARAGVGASLKDLHGGPGPLEITVVDVGGGSTECVQGPLSSSSKELTFKASLDMGSVRMTERYFSQQPALPSEITKASTAFRNMLQSELHGAQSTRICVGASGTARIMALVHLGLNELPTATGLASISRLEMGDWARRLFQMTYNEIMDLHPTKMQGRADVLPAGALILSEILTFTGSETLVVSPFGVRHGVAIRYFRESGT